MTTRFRTTALALCLVLASGSTSMAQSFAPNPTDAQKGVIGTCDSADGCKTLTRACLKAKGTYKPIEDDGTKGYCTDGKDSAQAGQKNKIAVPTTTGAAVGGADFAAKGGTVEHAYCSTKAFCSVLKQTCQTSGKTFKKLGPKSGVCKD